MADHADEPESLVEKITEKIHGHGSSSSSSDSDSDDKSNVFDTAQSNIVRLFGREKPVHKVLGGGKRTLPLSLYMSLAELFYDLVVWWEKCGNWGTDEKFRILDLCNESASFYWSQDDRFVFVFLCSRG